MSVESLFSVKNSIEYSFELCDEFNFAFALRYFFENFSSQSFVGFEKLAEIIIEIPFAFPALF